MANIHKILYVFIKIPLMKFYIIYIYTHTHTHAYEYIYMCVILIWKIYFNYIQ